MYIITVQQFKPKKKVKYKVEAMSNGYIKHQILISSPHCSILRIIDINSIVNIDIKTI